LNEGRTLRSTGLQASFDKVETTTVQSRSATNLSLKLHVWNMARPRHLVLKALAKAVKTAVPDPTDIDDGVPGLDPGEMQLYSFFVPGLISEEYTIEVSQHVQLDDTLLDLEMRDGNVVAQQKFYVQGPQFVIPAADFHSSYPPQGHADQPNVSPRVVETREMP
jgi:hypothetical protein